MQLIFYINRIRFGDTKIRAKHNNYLSFKNVFSRFVIRNLPQI